MKTEETPPKFQPYVPPDRKMTEFSWFAVILGLIMTLVLGAANAYLGLTAGLTVAATYPAAVIGMAVLRLKKGTILEENLARTAGSIGESVAAGAIFTLPAFVIAGVWKSFSPADAYWKSTVLMLVGSILGVLFVSLIRRTMVEDRELPFPESVAASEIHKAGQSGASAAKFLFWNIGIGGVVYLLGVMKAFATDKAVTLGLAKTNLKLGAAGTLPVGAVSNFGLPSIKPAYIGVGYIIGPKLAALNFAGGVLAWGLMVPLLLYFAGPTLEAQGKTDWETNAAMLWRFVVRPIAVGGMLVGACYTLFRMRKNLAAGLAKSVGELRGPKIDLSALSRNERYMSSKVVLAMIAVVFVFMCALYIWFANGVVGGLTAAVVMLIVGFFFATVSGYLVGVIGSTNNPISGITLSTLIIAALLMVSLGVSGMSGIAAVLGVAAVVCVSSAVAGELLQDFKVGHILGGTPRTIQIVELVAVVAASLLMYFPLMVLHEGDIKAGGTGFGGQKLAAPQAGLMASLASGIVNNDMAWPLVCVGIAMGIAMIMMQVRSPMLIAVGMYLPLGTTFAIFVGGMIRWLTDSMAERRGYNTAQRIRVENIGVLVASGMITGEGLMGLVEATAKFFEWPLPEFFEDPSYLLGFVILLVLAGILVRIPLANAGRPDEPAPPSVAH
jgi:putative OPT family oligopeptide transporter